MKKITLNGKSYPAEEVTFNTICKFEDMGVQMSEIGKKSITLIRAYVAACMDCDAETAGKEIESHIVAGGDLESITAALNHAIEESGFFQALSKRAEEKSSESAEEAE